MPHAGPGVLCGKNDDGSIEVELKVWNFKVTYNLENYGSGCARLK